MEGNENRARLGKAMRYNEPIGSFDVAHGDGFGEGINRRRCRRNRKVRDRADGKQKNQRG